MGGMTKSQIGAKSFIHEQLRKLFLGIAPDSTISSFQVYKAYRFRICYQNLELQMADLKLAAKIGNCSPVHEDFRCL